VSLHIRHADLTDMPALARIFREASLTNGDDRADLLAHPEVLQYDDGWVRAQRTRVAIVDGQVVAFATTVPADDAMELEDLFVDPAWMRRGIASALVRDAVALARASGAPRLEVTGNHHARAFYEHAGFSVDGPARTRFGPALRMHLDVTP
jgi:GNAT superfamily N-acetyltransferase